MTEILLTILIVLGIIYFMVGLVGYYYNYRIRKTLNKTLPLDFDLQGQTNINEKKINDAIKLIQKKYNKADSKSSLSKSDDKEPLPICSINGVLDDDTEFIRHVNYLLDEMEKNNKKKK